MSERGGRGSRGGGGRFSGNFSGGGRRGGGRARPGGERRDRDDHLGAEAVRKAAQQRPEGGYSLADFDDIPVPGAETEGQAEASRTEDVDGSMRLQKALANAGVASRRVCEQYIEQGRVTVNGRVVTELGSRVHPANDRIEVDGTPVQVDQSMRYVILNKPTGVVSSMRDEQGRPDLRQFTREYAQRLYNVGRLDSDTSGLLILTNDGDLANVLAHPSYGVEKTYVAMVRGRVSSQTLQRLLDGFDLEDGFIKADRAIVHADQPSRTATLVELTLHSGRNRIVRRMLDHVGHPVLELVRRSFGPLHLGTLRAGESRELTSAELGKLLTLARRAQRRPEEARPEHVRRERHGRLATDADGCHGDERDGGRDAGSDGGRDAERAARPATRDRQAPKDRSPGARGESNRAQRRSDERRFERGERREGGDRRVRDDRRERSDRGDRRDREERRERDDRGDRRSYGERRSYGDRPDRGERRSYGDRPDHGERRPYGDRPDRGERRPYSDRPNRDERGADRGERRPYGGGTGRGPNRGTGGGPNRGPNRGPGRRPSRGR